MRNFAPDDQEVSRQFATSVRGAFDEDRAVLNAVHKGMANKRTPNLDLKIDVGPMRFRRNLSKLIAAESQQLAAAE
jgi:vanillate O-demethylase monooxygenase subunit